MSDEKEGGDFNKDQGLPTVETQENVTLPSGFKEMKKATIGESYKFLNQLIRHGVFQNHGNLKEWLWANEKLPLFEESLRLIVIDSLHLENDIVKILLTQEDYQIKRILKCTWFFEDTLTAEYYTTQIFPHVSASLRCKIINKLSKSMKSEEKAEKLLEFIRHNYSHQHAELLLPKCSKEFLVNYITQMKPRFQYNTSCNVLLKICRRSPDVGINILYNMCESELEYDIYRYKKVIFYLAGNHPDVFVPFFEKHHSKLSYLNFGRKLNRHLGLKLKNFLFTSSEVSKSGIFNLEHLFRSFGFEDKIHLLSSLVLFKHEKLTFYNWKVSSDELAFFLKWIKPNRRLFAIEMVFKKVYKLNFNDYPNLWKPDVLSQIPVSQRLSYIEKVEKIVTETQDKSENSDLQEWWQPETIASLYDFKRAFQKLKELLSKAPSVHRRQVLIELMVHNCVVNKDLQGLQELVDFIVTRHRNDDPILLFDFLGNINRSFSTSDLNSTILEKMEEISYFCALKGHIRGYDKLLEKIIFYRYENGLMVDEYLKKFFNFSVLRIGYPKSFIEDYKSPHFLKLFYACCEEIQKWIHSNSLDVKTCEILLKSVLATCEMYNKASKKNRVDLKVVPGLEEELQKQLKKKKEEIGGGNWGPEIWEKYYSELTRPYLRPKFLFYIMKKNPELVNENLGKIVDYWLTLFNKVAEEFFIVSKKIFSFLEMSDRVKESVLSEFKTGSSIWKRKNALIIYSYLSNVNEFVEVIGDYIPKKEKVDGKIHSDFSEIQLLIPRIIKNLTPRHKSLNLILQFFFGDFLKSVMPSFYTCCYNTRTDEIVPFLKEYLGKVPQRISFKKDLIRLIAELTTFRERVEFCLKTWEENSHYSIRTILLMFVSKSFLEQPTKEGFEALKKCMKESDNLVIISRPNLDEVPKEYIDPYVSVLWEISETYDTSSKYAIQNSILWFFVRKNIGMLSQDFCEKILKNNLFKSTSLNVDIFAVHYLVSDKAKVSDKTFKLLELLEPAIQSNYPISEFLQTLCRVSLGCPDFFVDVFDILIKNWPKCSVEVLYGERLILYFYALYHKILKNSENVENKLNYVSLELGKEIKKHFLELKNLRDLVVILIEVLSSFLGDLSGEKKSSQVVDRLLVIKELVADLNDRSLAIIGISSLPGDLVALYHSKDQSFDNSETIRKNNLNELVQILKSYQDEVVDIYFRRKFGPETKE